MERYLIGVLLVNSAGAEPPPRCVSHSRVGGGYCCLEGCSQASWNLVLKLISFWRTSVVTGEYLVEH